MVRLPLFLSLALVVSAGCGGGLDTTSPTAPTVQVTASGVVNGKFPAVLRVIFNQPATKGQTSFSLINAPNPGLDIQDFACNSLFVGMPAPRTITAVEGQTYAAVKLTGGAFFASNVNSVNDIFITGTGQTQSQPDGSIAFEIHGSMQGSATSTESSDIFNFTVDF